MTTEPSSDRENPEKEAAEQRFWERFNEPFNSIGCIFGIALLLFIVLYFLLSLVWAPLQFWSANALPLL